MSISISDFAHKVTLESVAGRFNRTNVEATFEQELKIAETLRNAGYDAGGNSSVFDAIVKFAGMVKHGKVRKGLFLIGPCGVGKSTGMEMVSALTGTMIVTAKALQQAYMDSPTGTEWENICLARDYFGNPQPLIIDDIGSEDYPFFHYGSKVNVIGSALEYRYQALCRYGVWTAVTTNLSDEELRQRYGFRIDDRLNEMFYFCLVNGRSLR